ncbi:MAG: molybdopterin-dependent oxidoreductase [Nitrospirae bacterium]|nr:molybdopterin-dependent oxidoreductase [Nitrospirota bacterium]
MKTILRRDFLKYTAAGASVMAANSLFGELFASSADQGGYYVNRNTGKRVKGIPTTCGGCGAGCGIVAYVQDGVLMKLNGNPAHPVNQGRLCLIGQAGLYAQCDPERLMKPMRRTGKRGEGRWQEISWEDAASEIVKHLKSSTGRKLVVETAGGPSSGASEEFLSRLGGGLLVSHGCSVSPSREAALTGTFGCTTDVPDLANTGYILNFGADPFSCGSSGVRAVADIVSARSKDSTVKLVTFDPRLSPTAGRSDEWMPLLPGTDTVVALAMANVIMHEGLYDGAFIARWTNTTPAALKEHLASFTPSLAERISGVKADDIRRLAAEFARVDKGVVLTGGGVSKHPNGTSNERAVRLLSVITGKLNRRGCNLMPRFLKETAAAGGVDRVAPEAFYKSLKDGSRRVGAYIIHGADPAYGSPEAAEIAKLLADEAALPFIVTLDTHITDTGLYADLVLPVTTYLEEYSVDVVPGPDGEPVIGYGQPVVIPVGSSKPYVDALAGIASAAGRPLGYSDSEDYAAQAASRLGAGIDNLAATGYYFTSGHGSHGIMGGAGLSGYATPSGKIDIAWKEGPALPSYEQPEQYKNFRDDEFVLVKYDPTGYNEGATENNLYLKEINHGSQVFINAAVGRALGLGTRDKVHLTTSIGKIEVEVMLSPGVHPRTVALAAGSGHAGYGKIEKAERFESQDPFTDCVWWHQEGEGLGVNPNRIIPFAVDKESGGQGWMLTKVTLAKA